MEIFTKPTFRLVSHGWAPESINAGVCEAHKRFIEKLVFKMEFRVPCILKGRKGWMPLNKERLGVKISSIKPVKLEEMPATWCYIYLLPHGHHPYFIQQSSPDF